MREQTRPRGTKLPDGLSFVSSPAAAAADGQKLKSELCCRAHLSAVLFSYWEGREVYAGRHSTGHLRQVRTVREQSTMIAPAPDYRRR